MYVCAAYGGEYVRFIGQKRVQFQPRKDNFENTCTCVCFYTIRLLMAICNYAIETSLILYQDVQLGRIT